MCGIAGKIYLGQGFVSHSELELMAEKIAHRGPDDEGLFISNDRKVGLANRRLAIIDLSPKGHQPMSYKGRYWITFNGEIYNFQTERKILEKQGYRFHSNTDTEVILALYDRYKTKCLEHLRGMFAFAIYDKLENTLFLARDRIGKKPLKYFFDNNVFIFASELKSILTQSQVKKEPDLTAIHNYLTYGYVPSPNTGFKNIYKLEPGHYLTLDLKSKKLKKNIYWKPDFSEKLNIDESEWCNRILAELEESTKLRMIADVPIGAFLSGGVDSSAVVAIMARLSSKPVKTFTIGFANQKSDERHHAERIAKLYNTEHTTLTAKPESIEELLPQLVYQYEEPFADSSALITYMVCKMARKYVTVVLTGDGGDENFAGYDHRMKKLQRDVSFDKLQWLAKPIGIPASSLLSKITNYTLAKRINMFLEKSKMNLADRYVTYNSYFTNEDKNLLYSNEFMNDINNTNSYRIARNKFQESKAIDPRDQALYFDLISWLPDSQLVKVDIASMSASLEARSPFLDQDMIELAAKIPFDLKVRGGEFKYILKKAVEKIVPKENLYRKKMGFSIPLDRWFTGKLNKYTSSKLLSRKAFLRKTFNRDYIKKMLNTHSEKSDFGPKLWSLLTLEMWAEKYFD